MIRWHWTPGRAQRSSTIAAVSLAAGLLATAGPVLAHAPDPTVGGAAWAQNQSVGYAWRAGQVPPAWLRAAIDDAAADSNGSRSSRAARFTYDADATSLVSYGEPTGCGPNGIACFSRANAPDSFAMWFRRHGYVFDWGALRWCQASADPSNGCFDAENIALDEFGHVQKLGHHENLPDGSDYEDAVVQTISRAKPRPGWDTHSYGRCDVATLQRIYDTPNTAAPYSTCLDLATGLSLAASDRSPSYRGAVTFTSKLWVVDHDAYERLGGNAVDDRTVRLQRRAAGGSTWMTVATMSSTDVAGTYRVTLTLTSSADFRARFSEPAGEGLRGDDSPIVDIYVAPCTVGCPVDGPTALPVSRQWGPT